MQSGGKAPPQKVLQKTRQWFDVKKLGGDNSVYVHRLTSSEAQLAAIMGFEGSISEAVRPFHQRCYAGNRQMAGLRAHL